MVLLGIGIILLSIFIPYLMKVREMDRRTRCADNLKQIYAALTTYQQANDHAYPRVVYDEAHNPTGYTAFTGADDPNPFAAGSAVRPNDVTASLWLLLRLGLLRDPSVFICPSSDDSRDLMTDASNERVVDISQRGNFRRPTNLSYGYSSPFSNAPGYRMDDSRSPDFALVADKGPRVAVDDQFASLGPSPFESPLELSRSNSPNHGYAGQNVLHGGGWVWFERTPFCGVGLVRADAAHPNPVAGDDIYTAQASHPPATQPAANLTGYWGHNIGPASAGDSDLVPTQDDGAPNIEPPPTTSPATAPAHTTPPPATGATTSATAPH